jgi:glutamine synthetase
MHCTSQACSALNSFDHDSHHLARPSEKFGMNVLSLSVLQNYLPNPMFNRFLDQVKGLKPIDKETSDAIAHAAKAWALERGATHFTHWFQPMTNATAEKHDSFLTLKYQTMGSTIANLPFDSFSGSQLVQAEPDASSFPHGGSRTTFEARGYTIWDTTSPMFLKDGPNESKILYIPSVFISYNGQALDEKTLLLRSNDVLNQAAVELLSLIGKPAKRVHVTLGTEQEFFLIDKELYLKRFDIKISGRSLLGAVPPKHQQLEDHYFASIPPRVLSCIAETENELIKLGVPIKTRHNEVAPMQFEMAPIFEEASVAVDHNLLTMEVLSSVADKYGLKALFHEKPFKGVNGSGKHCNWSLMTSEGENLLEPTDRPEENLSFLVVLISILAGLTKHAGLLRAAIASSSNQWRLGANEAPPSIISVFLGAYIHEVLNSIEEDRSPDVTHQTPKIKTVELGAKSIDLKIKTLPDFTKDLTDRNRTSPFAFTGNKFEFRAVGSGQSPSFPVAMINAIAAAGMLEVISELKKTKNPNDPKEIKKVLKKFIKESKAIRFEGDGYSMDWRNEAEKRGLLNCKTEPEAFQQMVKPENLKLITDVLGIASKEEIGARYHILCEKYVKDMVIEAKTLLQLVKQNIIPAAFEYEKELVSIIVVLDSLNASNVQKSILGQIDGHLNALYESTMFLEKNLEDIQKESDNEVAAAKAVSFISLMEQAREYADALEAILPQKIYPFPKYNQLLLSED